MGWEKRFENSFLVPLLFFSTLSYYLFGLSPIYLVSLVPLVSFNSIQVSILLQLKMYVLMNGDFTETEIFNVWLSQVKTLGLNTTFGYSLGLNFNIPYTIG